MPRTILEYRAGDRFGAYSVTRVEELPEIQGSYIELSHDDIEARHIHVAAPDDNNMFSVLFPTVPQDSTGVAHILEHVALMGSERFDVYGTFYKMGPRSLNTFLNASTSPDTTQYYFTTRNEKDFYNLLEVYLDAAFFPRLDELTFKQEGHRLEFSNPEDPASELTIKGVVYNEMKGQRSTPAYLMFRAWAESLYPDLTYAYWSGGEPDHIPDLTWEQLKAFHARHYHPSNSFFFTYGDLPLAEILSKIQDHVLSRFDSQPIDVNVPDQPRFSQPRRVEYPYPLSKEQDPARKAQVAVGWVTAGVTDSFETLVLEVIGDVLLSNAGSPLRKALIDSELGEALSDGTGLHTFYKEISFGAGLKGTSVDDAEAIERLILSTLERLVKEGIDRELVEAAVHGIEIAAKEVSNSGGPYPLKLFSRIRGRYVYGGDPYASLRVDEDLAMLKTKLAEDGFLETEIRRWFIDNPHRVLIVLKPDHDLETRLADAEQERISSIRAGLTEEQIGAIIGTCKTLAQRQNEEQDLSSLPSLELSDIPPDLEYVPHELVDTPRALFATFEQPTNDLSYFAVRFRFDHIPEDQQALVPLFAHVLTRSGAAGDDYVALARRIDRYTGGIAADAKVRSMAQGNLWKNFTISGMALATNQATMLQIVEDILTSHTFTVDRTRDLVRELRASIEGSILMNGHSYAMGLAASTVRPAGSASYRLGGLGFLDTLKALEADPDGVEGLIESLHSLGRQMTEQRAAVCLTSTGPNLGELLATAEGVLSRMPMSAHADATVPEPTLSHIARATSAQVAYNASARRAPRIGEPLAAATHVLTGLLRSEYLLRELRQKGGAYGAGAGYDRESGVFSFYSYRDPNITKTLEAFESSLRWAAAADIKADSLKEAIMTACRSVDPLQSPSTKGRRQFFNDLAGYTVDLQMEYKSSLTKVDNDQLRQAADLLLDTQAATATISSEDKIMEANDQMGGVFRIERI